jgi:hypothetical protein
LRSPRGGVVGRMGEAEAEGALRHGEDVRPGDPRGGWEARGALCRGEL